MNRAEFYKRVAGVIAPERLQSRRVVVIGVGSGGSRVAAELARLGVDLMLVERPGEVLEEHNIIRHLLGYRSLGKSKLFELKRHLQNLYPFVHLTLCALDVVEDAELFLSRLEKWRPDLLAVCTDNEQSKHAANQVALRLGIPQVGAGVYDGGIGGKSTECAPARLVTDALPRTSNSSVRQSNSRRMITMEPTHSGCNQPPPSTWTSLKSRCYSRVWRSKSCSVSLS